MMMPDIKVFIGGRSFSISCGPGEESDASDSAKLLDKEAELIQEQLGRLPEDKMLLLSGLLLADKLRTLKFEKQKLEQRLVEQKTQLEEVSLESDIENESRGIEDSQISALKRVSDMLDTLIDSVSKTEDDSISSEDIQKSFI
tara:strand:- start:43 stop:471 length:429 start_codon:yes stop_codon:yes gene_type:complete